MYRIFQGERILQDSTLFARAHREKKLASEEARKFFIRESLVLKRVTSLNNYGCERSSS